MPALTRASLRACSIALSSSTWGCSVEKGSLARARPYAEDGGVGKAGLMSGCGISCREDSGEGGYEAGEMMSGGEAKFTCFWDALETVWTRPSVSQFLKGSGCC